MSPASPSGLVVEIAINSAQWAAVLELEQTVQNAIRLAAGEAGAAGEVSVLLTDDEEIRVLNRTWRSQDKATNVLSFPAAPVGFAPPDAPRPLGDIAIAYETVEREAGAEGKPLLHHVAHMAVHGFLHLVGHDHDEDQPAEAMESAERTILARLGIPDPYAASRVSA